MGQPGIRASLISPRSRRRLEAGLDLALRGEELSLIRRARAMRGRSVTGRRPRRVITRPVRADECPGNGPETPAVSVVIPCFNHGSFVAEALSSVLAQTCDSWEAIVVEGGSTDRTTRAQVSELESWADPRVKVLYRDQPSRLGDNRHFGIQHALGRYICCLDADDRLDRAYLDVAIFLLEKRHYDLVSSAIRCFGDESRCVGTLTYPVLADLLKINWMTSAAVFRRDLYDRTGGYQDVGLGADYVFEDWRLWVRMAALGARITNIPAPLFLYRSHSGPRLSQDPALPGHRAQRRAVASLNKDVVSRLSRRRSRQLRAWEILARDQEPAVPAQSAMPGGGTLIVDESGTEGPLPLSSMIASPTGGSRTVLASTSRRPRSISPTAGDPGQVEHFELFALLKPQDWRDFCSYLIHSKGLTELGAAAETGRSDLLDDLRRLHPGLRIVNPPTPSPARP